MFNISYRKSRSKPFVKKIPLIRSNKDFTYSETKDVASVTKNVPSITTNALNASESDTRVPETSLKKHHSEMNDYNQNIIDTSPLSWEELETVMGNLEKQIVNKIPEINIDSQVVPERDTSGTRCEVASMGYENLMTMLEKFEGDSIDEMGKSMPEINESMERLSGKGQTHFYGQCTSKPETHVFKEDLAMAELQLEEKNATISLLKDQLRAERKSMCEKLKDLQKSHAGKLQGQEEKFKGIVTRHQKFIEQLISEKSDLSEKCSSLTQRIKELEGKFQRDLKVLADRHVVELQRAKEHCAAAEKIRRERWVENRTLKIKEMTVKGLEPELRNMVEQHEEEIQKLRNIHMQELQDTEFRLLRQSNQQLEQLRLELTASHEKVLANEKNILWARHKENLEEQEAQFQSQKLKFLEDMKKERQTLLESQEKRDLENETALQESKSRFEKEIENLKQQHSAEKKNLEESLKTEWEIWLADYKRQQLLKFEKAKDKIKDECNKEKDRHVELIVQRLEEESRQKEASLRQSFENKLKSLTEKYDSDMQTMIDNEKLQKDKLGGLKEKLDAAEVRMNEMEKKVQEYSSDLNSAHTVIAELKEEKENAKKFARQEIEGEKRELEEKISSLYTEISQINLDKETWVAQLHSRIKLVMTQKVLTIRNLTKELEGVKRRCEHLEKLLDQQRREFILRSV